MVADVKNKTDFDKLESYTYIIYLNDVVNYEKKI